MHDIPTPPKDTPFVVAAFYKFVRITDPPALRTELQSICSADLRGTILIAPEGINATLSGSRDALARFLGGLWADARFADLAPKYSFAEAQAFTRMKLRLKKEIVTMGVADTDPTDSVGRYVRPEDWNALMREEGVMVIDTRNDYEVAVGSFENAVNPQTERFRDFPKWVEENLDKLPPEKRPRKIAMFCTGGIRCEKSTSYLVSKGYENVFHLEGGVLKYLETVPKEQSAWQGACFVFDKRVAVAHGLAEAAHSLCYACRMPLTPADTQRATYEAGVSCHHCIDTHSDADRARFRERVKQIALAGEES